MLLDLISRFKMCFTKLKCGQLLLQMENAPRYIPGGQYSPRAVGGGSQAISNPRQTAYQMRVDAMNYSTGPKSRDATNQDAADALRSMISNGGDVSKVKTVKIK